MKKKYLALSIPTGIGLDIGGYAGDFGHIAREFSKHFKLILNPNAVNGGILSAINDEMLYTEGFALDNFLMGKINLQPVNIPNKIGVIFDCAIPKDILNIHINTLNALKIVEGYDILPYMLTSEPVGIDFSINKHSKVSTGSIKNPKTLLETAKKLIDLGAQALAVICFFKDYDEFDDLNYINAQGVDPIGGVEAIISHLLVKEFGIMSAHSPAFSKLEISDKIEDKKVASELISSTYLPCVIRGLNRAPKIIKNDISDENIISYKDICGFVVPEKALGSPAVLACVKNNIPIYTVDNKTPLNIGFKELKIDVKMHFDDYFSLLNYLRENQ
ncbi:MAG: DUF3326 domain-containing protein [Cyanobacteria bacterium SIG30]|nr:DUF3326 domain-containing protein [Cyanobacteria bacterium SIG30]